MNLLIEVSQLADTKDISFNAIELLHANCAGKRFSIHRELMTENYTLRCVCGINLRLLANKGAVELIVKVAIGAEPTQLLVGTYTCTPSTANICLRPKP